MEEDQASCTGVAKLSFCPISDAIVPSCVVSWTGIFICYTLLSVAIEVITYQGLTLTPFICLIHA